MNRDQLSRKLKIADWNKDDRMWEVIVDSKEALTSINDDLSGIKTELIASMLLSQPNDEYKLGFNSAMKKAISIIDLYKSGEGIFQIHEDKKI